VALVQADARGGAHAKYGSNRARHGRNLQCERTALPAAESASSLLNPRRRGRFDKSPDRMYTCTASTSRFGVGSVAHIQGCDAAMFFDRGFFFAHVKSAT